MLFIYILDFYRQQKIGHKLSNNYFNLYKKLSTQASSLLIYGTNFKKLKI